MKKAIIFCLYFFPGALFAQDASNMLPKQSTVKDTARQTDLIDIAKDLFNINPKAPRVQHEKKIYFSILPVPGSVPGGNGRALITSTTAGTYLGPQSTTNLSSATFAPYWNLKSLLVYRFVRASGSGITPGTSRAMCAFWCTRNIRGVLAAAVP